MTIQIIFLALFAGNMLSIWSTYFLNKCAWYRIPGMAVFLVLPFLTVYFRQPLFELDFVWWRVAGVLAMIAGAVLLIWSKFLFKPQEEMIETGPYRFVRHPQYLGMIFLYVGWWWVWESVYSFYFGMFIIAMVWLEAYLE